jgi:hypothetical protein
VNYSFLPKAGEGEYAFDVEARLCAAKAAGVIVAYDGRDRVPWFEGPPGKAIRELAREFARAPRRPDPQETGAARAAVARARKDVVGT